MSQEARGYPHKQGFCVTPKPNKTKKNSWWAIGNNNNRSKKSKTNSGE